jgi:hypothetical protein
MESTFEKKPVPCPCAEKDRMAVQLMISHMSPGDDPTQANLVHSAGLKTTGNQTYSRQLTVNGVWAALDHGWLEARDVGLIVLQNRTGDRQRHNPNDEEKEELARAVLEVSFSDSELQAQLRIEPGQFSYFYPDDVRKVRIRAAHGGVKLKLYVFPR